MVGMGESDEEIYQTLQDLKTAGVRAVTLGQYLRPSKMHMNVHRYVSPEEFAEYERRAREDFGFDMVASGPLVRSSYKAGELYLERMIERDRAMRRAGVGEDESLRSPGWREAQDTIGGLAGGGTVSEVGMGTTTAQHGAVVGGTPTH